jgi:hypothetical protein
MHIIFGSVHVTGAYASTPVDLADSPNDNEVDEDEKKTPQMSVFLVYQKRVRSVMSIPLMG